MASYLTLLVQHASPFLGDKTHLSFQKLIRADQSIRWHSDWASGGHVIPIRPIGGKPGTLGRVTRRELLLLCGDYRASGT